MKFHKYQGAGNDFIIIDNRHGLHSQLPVQALCDRHFGIGADGLMLLEKAPGYDFRMVYYNSDGRESTLCGNGGRCLSLFAIHLGLAEKEVKFVAIDGEHHASLLDDGNISLQMHDVLHLEKRQDDYVVHTGSPHFVRFTDRSPNDYDLMRIARDIRFSQAFEKDGINVNLVEIQEPRLLSMRTYERGVEDETLSCGTGVTAAAICAHQKQGAAEGVYEYTVAARGGLLRVNFETRMGIYRNVWLTGPAVAVFEGEVKV
jgi:diaminopimelate epimerase